MNANESKFFTLHQMHELYGANTQPHSYYHLNGMNSKIFYLNIRRSPLFIISSNSIFRSIRSLLSFSPLGANLVRLKNGTVYGCYCSILCLHPPSPPPFSLLISQHNGFQRYSIYLAKNQK